MLIQLFAGNVDLNVDLFPRNFGNIGAYNIFLDKDLFRKNLRIISS